MNASSLITITFFTYMLRQNVNVSIKDYISPLNWHQTLRKIQYTYRAIPSNEDHVSIITNSMIRTYTSDIDERIILR